MMRLLAAILVVLTVLWVVDEQVGRPDAVCRTWVQELMKVEVIVYRSSREYFQ